MSSNRLSLKFSMLIASLLTVSSSMTQADSNESESLNVHVETGNVVSVAVGDKISSSVNIGVVDETTNPSQSSKIEIRIGDLHQVFSGGGISVITVTDGEESEDEWDWEDWE